MNDVKLSGVLLLAFLCLAVEATTFPDLSPGRYARRRYDRSRNATFSRSLEALSTENQGLIDFVALVDKFDYPGEEHTVTTVDGYRLRLHRIPGSPKWPKSKGKPVAYFQHGLFASSDTWVLMGPQKDLAYILADAGYDVWLGNIRGNTYSRAHKRLSSDYNPEFWQFSFHEVGLYDMPATIDYILEKTDQKSLIYVGHSMGTTISYVLLSMKPEYNEKISLVISLAPVGFWREPYTPLIKFLKDNTKIIKNFVVSAHIYEMFPLTEANSRFVNTVCKESSKLQTLCLNFLYMTSGYNPKQLNRSAVPLILSHMPAGTSAKTLIHYSQNMKTGDFKMFDYGLIQNFATYKQADPPSYELKNIVAPVALFYGRGDALITPRSVLELAEKLPNVVTVEAVPDPHFSHLDFIFAKDIKTLLNDRVMEIITQFTNLEST